MNVSLTELARLAMWLIILGAMIFIGERIFGQVKIGIERNVARNLNGK